ncbi:MAG: hypothetical protein DWQ35_13805 [Planctomycetota bacterium]|nr:MAG: hypothetical protein DWQ35_13805 [Planctomycetota bacterium]REK25983.1 MAG: hypothetical protein DWQ42_10155 [Planctomycetota bacterium]REK46902.1 MAG: hypothetical protein DWQ46_05250 [Planctomycetota bacterium]
MVAAKIDVDGDILGLLPTENAYPLGIPRGNPITQQVPDEVVIPQAMIHGRPTLASPIDCQLGDVWRMPGDKQLLEVIELLFMSEQLPAVGSPARRIGRPHGCDHDLTHWMV